LFKKCCDDVGLIVGNFGDEGSVFFEESVCVVEDVSDGVQAIGTGEQGLGWFEVSYIGRSLSTSPKNPNPLQLSNAYYG